MITECTVDPVHGVFTHHDFSQPPHNTPDNPRDAIDPEPCQARSADLAPCQHERRYQVVVYFRGSHDWVRLYACVPCTASLRRRHARLGPGDTNGIARIREVAA